MRCSGLDRVADARTHYDGYWRKPSIVGPVSDQTGVTIQSVTTEELLDRTGTSAEFASGYRRAAPALVPGLRIYQIVFRRSGQTVGVVVGGFVDVNDNGESSRPRGQFWMRTSPGTSIDHASAADPHPTRADNLFGAPAVCRVANGAAASVGRERDRIAGHHQLNPERDTSAGIREAVASVVQRCSQCGIELAVLADEAVFW